VRNSVQLLQRLGVATGHPARAVEILDRQVGHLIRLVDDLLDVARIGQGKVGLSVQNIDLRSAVEAAMDASRPLLDLARHQLDVQLPETAVIVRADVTRTVQVFANLLNNAAKYTPAGGLIRVSMRCEAASAIVTVADNGVGIPADMLAKVFDLFAQVRSHEVHAQGGLGIGLSLVKRLVEMQGGNVTVESDGPGRGTTFTIRFPLAHLGTV